MKATFTTLLIFFSISVFSQGNIAKSFKVYEEYNYIKMKSYSPPNTKTAINASKNDSLSNLMKQENKDKKREYRKMKRDNAWDVNSVSFYGGGNIFGILTANKDSTRSAAPTGEIGLNITTNRMNWEIIYTVSDMELVEIQNIDQYGSFLLNPMQSKQTFALNVRRNFGNMTGISSLISVGSSKWKFENADPVNASVFLFKPGFYWMPFSKDKDDSSFNEKIENSFGILFTASPTYRTILGDYERGSYSINGNILKNRGYWGMELSFVTIINNLKLSLQYNLNDKTGLNINGFSGNQFSITAAINTDVISLYKKTKK